MLPPVTSAPKSRSHHTGEQVQAGVGAHQRRTTCVLDRAAHSRTDRRERVTLKRHKPQVLALVDSGDPGLHSAPEEHAVVGRLAATAGVEGRPVQHDALGVDVDHHGVPLAKGLVGEFEPGRSAMVVALAAPFVIGRHASGQ